MALLLVVAMFGTAWALTTPAWLAPDEDVHFAYVQTLAERHELPGSGPSAVSTQQRQSMLATNTDEVVFFPDARPEWTGIADRRWRKEVNRSPEDDGGGANTSTGYPPAYYLSAVPAYVVASGGDVLTELTAVRLTSVLWLLLTTVGAWLLAGEIFRRDRLLQLTAAAFVGLWPMLSFISSSANPDAMLFATWAFALWLGVKILNGGVTPWLAGAFGACVGLAFLAKPVSLALVPPALLVLGLSTFRDPGPWKHRLRSVAAAAIAMGLAAAAWSLSTWLPDRPTATDALVGSEHTSRSLREFASYLWQFYLPRLDSQVPLRLVIPVIASYPAYNVWIGTSWAAFGWVNRWFDPAVYWVFLGITLTILAAAGLASVRDWRHRSSTWKRALPVAAFLGLAVGSLLLGLHWAEYTLRYPALQARYLFPVAAVGGLVVAQAVRAAPPRWRSLTVSVLLAGLLVFQFACLFAVGAAYYA